MEGVDIAHPAASLVNICQSSSDSLLSGRERITFAAGQKKQREHEKPGMVFHRESSSAKRKVVFITREGGTGKAKPHGNNSKRIDEKPEMSSGNPCSTATENKIEINERNIA